MCKENREVMYSLQRGVYHSLIGLVIGQPLSFLPVCLVSFVTLL